MNVEPSQEQLPEVLLGDLKITDESKAIWVPSLPDLQSSVLNSEVDSDALLSRMRKPKRKLIFSSRKFIIITN